MPKSLWQIKLIIETDEEAEVDRVADEVSRVACPTTPHHMTAEHRCAIPWMVITSPIEGAEADGWRDDLNR